MNTFAYFAYGSNMFTKRLRARCKSAEFRGRAYADGFRFAFSKRSQDGSGKATLIKLANPTARIWGVLFHIREDERDTLDKFEGKGKGYDRQDDFTVEPDHGGKEVACTYLASPAPKNDKLKPYDWYQALVLAGASERYLPATYVEILRRFESIPDPRPDRPQRIDALALLDGTDFLQMVK